MIIDIHSHFNRVSEYDCPENNLHKRNYEFMMQDYDNCGISCGGFCYYSSVLGNKAIYDDNQAFFDFAKDKEKVYHILVILHNLPKAMHGKNILNDGCNLVSYNDALLYAQGCMNEGMKEVYREYFD